jgi:hypothetical protein
MKINKEHMTLIKSTFDKLISYIPLDTMILAYETGDFTRSDAVKDLNKRFIWDIVWALKGYDKEAMSIIFDTYNGNHIETAIKSLVPKLQRNY